MVCFVVHYIVELEFARDDFLFLFFSRTVDKIKDSRLKRLREEEKPNKISWESGIGLGKNILMELT